jgi:predicted O-linked N-acetylglucosamine transferase (SPINDLY family)
MAQQPDVLIFSAIGMDWKMQQLASLRLAPVQITTWGHPETSGLPTIDYYLSGADFEPAEAPTYYREKLVCLPNLGSCYEPLHLPADEFDITELGANTDACLLIAPGTPFKYQPQHDYIYPEIAARVQNAKIVFFRSKPDGLTEAFERRIERAFMDKGLDMHNHAIFIPSVRKSRFHALLKQAHVYLDTLGFSGFNTFMQGMECGLPAVSYQGKFMRGRFGSAILHKMQLDELVASSVEEYIEKVVRLVNDDVYRKSIKKKIEKTVPQLYSDLSVVRALEAFILSVVNR